MATLMLLAVPIGSPSRVCGCGRLFYFVETPRKDGGVTRTPVDCNVEGGKAPTAEGPGRGANHFSNCALSTLYRKPKAKRGAR